jgi:nitric oxide reductase NorD protein
MRNTPLTAAEIEAQLDQALEQALSTRRTSDLAAALVPFTRREQDCVLRWTEAIAKTNTEMAFLFAAQAPEALRRLSLAGLEDWVIQAMDVYDMHGLFPACTVFRRVVEFAAEANAKVNGIAFEEISGVLELFVRGLSGRPLKIECADEVYTDTGTLFVPPRLSLFAERHDNFRLYKALVTHLWAQVWFGTFRLNPEDPEAQVRFLARFDDPGQAQRLFHALETMRLDAHIAVELPGLYRDLRELDALAGTAPYPPAWQTARERLQRPEATVHDSYALLETLYPAEPPSPRCYAGILRPERAAQTLKERLAREQDQFRTALTRLGEEAAPATPAAAEAQAKFQLRQTPDPDHPEHFSFELLLNGQPMTPTAEVRALMDSIIQDLGTVPEEYLVAAGDGGYRREHSEKRPEDVWKGTYHEEGAFLYNEWDYKRAHYRKDWCVLRELDVHPQDEPFVARTLNKYASVLAGLRKTFEALRGEDRLLKKQTSGDDIDFDALVEARTDMHQGRELSERLFIKRHKLERHIAVMFMVDMSGSTKGWINNAEREALVLLCEALEILGDRYAIYGFSGMTRKRCELYRVKRFDEPYSAEVRRRITGIAPKDYTRMGVTIRHLTKLLNEVEARTKLLITLSDGKPDDYDGYRGDYGIEDTRAALIEAKRAGIHPFCITIDTEARDYLPHMYGAVNWALVDDVKKLPLKVSDIYRRLTL